MNQLKVTITNEQDAMDVDADQLRRTVTRVFESVKGPAAWVNLAVLDDQAIRTLKEEFFGQSIVTDVISFDLRDDQDDLPGDPSELCAGDRNGGDDQNDMPEQASPDFEIVVNAQRALAVAGDATRAAGELNLYVVHGLLHQLGYDDQEPTQAQAMHEMEDQLLDGLGFGRVFSEAPAEVAIDRHKPT